MVNNTYYIVVYVFGIHFKLSDFTNREPLYPDPVCIISGLRKLGFQVACGLKGLFGWPSRIYRPLVQKYRVCPTLYLKMPTQVSRAGCAYDLK